MKMLRTMLAGLALLGGCFTVSAADAPTAQLWTSAEMKAFEKAIIPKMDATKGGSQNLVVGNTYRAHIMHREGSGEPENHIKRHDFLVILDGVGEIQVGGTVSGERTIAPNELKAAKLEGGETYKVAPGDVMFVPANTWHRIQVPPGGTLNALIFKAE